MKKFIILGNGFTIDFLKHINKLNEIDVINLFRNGENLPWPENNKLGFLSYKHCPNLWNLGIRPYTDNNNNFKIVEDIISCANMANSSEFLQNNLDGKIYLKAYKELITYLKFLFINYNKNFEFKENDIKEWGWYKFFKQIQDNDNIEEIIIVTYNYDIFLEQILKKIDINFKILGLEEKHEAKFSIIKPHGSISFRHQKEIDIDSFKIKYEIKNLDSELNDFNLDYDLNYTNNIPIVDALLPPAGDSSRFKLSWAEQLRKIILEETEKINENDELIISGISYWHVDRQEIDKILINLNHNMDVYLINPNPPTVLNAILTTIFKNVIVYTKSDNLGEIK